MAVFRIIPLSVLHIRHNPASSCNPSSLWTFPSLRISWCDIALSSYHWWCLEIYIVTLTITAAAHHLVTTVTTTTHHLTTTHVTTVTTTTTHVTTHHLATTHHLTTTIVLHYSWSHILSWSSVIVVHVRFLIYFLIFIINFQTYII